MKVYVVSNDNKVCGVFKDYDHLLDSIVLTHGNQKVHFEESADVIVVRGEDIKVFYDISHHDIEDGATHL